jgi:hypothetical protein
MKEVARWMALGLGALLTLYSLQGFVRMNRFARELGSTIWNWDMFVAHPIRMVFVPLAGLILLAVAAVLFLRRADVD